MGKKNNFNHNNNYISDNILGLKLDLLNKKNDNNQKEEEKIIEEKNNNKNNNNTNGINNINYTNYKNNPKLFMSDYNIFSSQKSEKNIQSINQNIKMTKKNLDLKKNYSTEKAVAPVNLLQIKSKKINPTLNSGNTPRQKT